MAVSENIIIFVGIFLLGGNIPGALAFDVGNQLALVIGVVLITCILMACLGAYSKRKNRH